MWFLFLCEFIGNSRILYCLKVNKYCNIFVLLFLLKQLKVKYLLNFINHVFRLVCPTVGLFALCNLFLSHDALQFQDFQDLFPYLSSHCRGKNIKHILSFIRRSLPFPSLPPLVCLCPLYSVAEGGSVVALNTIITILLTQLRQARYAPEPPYPSSAPPLSLYRTPMARCHNVRPTVLNRHNRSSSSGSAATVFVCDKVLNKH